MFLCHNKFNFMSFYIRKFDKFYVINKFNFMSLIIHSHNFSILYINYYVFMSQQI